MSDIIDLIKRYWKIILGVLFIVIGLIFLLLSDSSKDKLDMEITTLDIEISELKKELNQNELTVEQLEPEIETIIQSGSHALDMGTEMIEVQQVLTEHYKSIEPISEDDDLTELDDAQTAFTRMTKSTDYVHTWMLNDDWSMQLDSVATFKDADNIPVVFTMNLENGALGGIVRGRYNSENDLLKDIIVDYTVDGIADAIDVGGM